MYDESILPTLDINNNVIIIASKDINIIPSRVHIIDLGFFLLNIPHNSVVYVHNTNQSLHFLHNIWYQHPNPLTLPVIAATSVHLKAGDVLCQLQLLPISVLIAGKTFNDTYLVHLNTYPNILLQIYPHSL